MDKTEKKIALYYALLIAFLLNAGKLLALRENSVMARFSYFNAPEYGFQVLANFVFCYFILYQHLDNSWLAAKRATNRWVYIGLNVLLVFIGTVVLGAIQRYAFDNHQLRGIYWASYFARFALTSALTGIAVRIMLLTRETKKHIQEKEQLRSAYAIAELALLKEQLNPHFLFNALSSLSGVVRENPVRAQQYINHLSKVFRYSLSKPADDLVTLQDELTMVQSFAQLLQMRLEEGFQLIIDIEKAYYTCKLPHLSLQPLLENAAKHNAATGIAPLTVHIHIQDHYLMVTNNLRPMDADRNGIGLANLSERYKILMDKEIEIYKDKNTFNVKLPLKYE